HDDLRRNDGPVRGEHLLQLGVVDPPAQVADVQLLTHDELPRPGPGRTEGSTSRTGPAGGGRTNGRKEPPPGTPVGTDGSSARSASDGGVTDPAECGRL